MPNADAAEAFRVCDDRNGKSKINGWHADVQKAVERKPRVYYRRGREK